MKRALLSVSDKTGLVDFARALKQCGVELIASGGTATALSQAGLPVHTVESITGFPEMIGGRVKTLHPAIHAGILAQRTPSHLAELQANNITPIDLVVVNLYPFQQTIAKPGVSVADAIEQIDIGGVALLRAAAKNSEWVTVICDPADYALVGEEFARAGDTSKETRAKLALKSFRHTAAYDGAIAAYLSQQSGDTAQFPGSLSLNLTKVDDLRYGENPHQRAAIYRAPGQVGLADAKQLHGKPLSYTNWLDSEAAWRAANEYEIPAVAIIKHVTPSGIAMSDKLVQAYLDARECDPTSAFGGVVGLNRVVDADTATAIKELFTEVVIAPGFSKEALEILQAKKDLRLLEFGAPNLGGWELRSVGGSYLMQEANFAEALEWRVVSSRPPTLEEERALRFAWRSVKHVKSNAIVFARETKTVGIGAGQMSRVDSVKIAVEKAGERARGAVMASDAFFPFPDGVEAACRAGITAIAHPGGSIRDEESTAIANHFGAAMVFTGTRHFRH